MKSVKNGISLIVLVITIIVITIIAGVIIVYIQKNNPIDAANKAKLLENVDSFKSELESYKQTETINSLGKFNSDSIQADNLSLSQDGAVISNKNIYAIIPSLERSGYLDTDFIVKDGKLVYRGVNQKYQEWLENINNVYVDKGSILVSITSNQNLPVKAGTNIEYNINISSEQGLKQINQNDILSGIKILDSTNTQLDNQPNVQVKNYVFDENSLNISLLVNTADMGDGEYILKLNKNIVENKSNRQNDEVVDTKDIFEIDSTAPVAPIITPNITQSTNQDVTVTITYSNDSVIKKYSYDGSNWLDYTTDLTITKNCTIYAKSLDKAKNESSQATLTINNIDKTAPVTPIIIPSTTQPTNQNVIVTITYPDDSVKNQYSFDGSSWIDYTKNLTITDNCTIYAKAIDAAGNQSSQSSLTLNNIDKVAPIAPIIIPNTTQPTSQNVIVTITYPDDAAIKQYSFDGSSWLNYTTTLTITNNCTIYAKAIDAAGNQSSQSSLTISNINKIAQIIPSTTNWTNQNITITINYPNSAYSKTYSYDGSNWLYYDKPLIIDHNKTIYVEYTNSDGSVQNPITYSISNIDKILPVITFTPSGNGIKVNLSDDGGSNIKLQRYAYSSQESNRPDSGWNNFENGQEIAFPSDSNNYYLWVEAIDNASNTSLRTFNLRSLTSKVDNYENGNNTFFTYSGNWHIDSSQAYEGSHSYTNATIGDSQSCSTTFVYNNTNIDGYSTHKLSFWYKVSSESGYDFLTVTLNGNALVHASGEVGWTYIEANLLSGNNTITFTYSKDGSNSRGSDRGYIDLVKVEPVTLISPQISVDKTNWTNQDVIANIQYPSSATKCQYGFDGNTWYDYTGSIDIPSNRTIYAKALDTTGRTSNQSTLSISNIDKTLPTIDYIINGNYKVVVNDDGGSGVNYNSIQYMWDTQNRDTPTNGWQSYTNYSDISKPSDKTYLWIKAYDIAGNVNITNSNQFSLINDDYENNKLKMPYSGNWHIDGSQAYQGSHSYTNATIGDSQSCSTTFIYNNSNIDGYSVHKLSFWYKVSSESGYDFLTVTLNGSSLVHVSGEVGWTYFETNLPAGNNTITFTYSKDGSNSRGNDSGYIDLVKIEPVTLISPQISVDKTNWTNQDVITNIQYPISSIRCQYGFDGNTWYDYTSSINIPSNRTIYARALDLSGRTSNQSTYTVTNIDKTLPTIDYIINGNYKVVVNDDGGSGVNYNSIQYVWDTQNVNIPINGWQSYTNYSDISKSSDKTYLWIKAYDIAGNVNITNSNQFSLINDDYENNKLKMPYSGNWHIDGSQAYQGSHSYTNATIGDSQSCSTTFIYNNSNIDGYSVHKLSFWYKVSSESGYDFLTVTLNGSNLVHASGEVAWTYFETNLPAGNNTITFTYSKDGSNSRGSDRGYIDLVKIIPVK